jgi:hypothetical protein
MPIHDVRCPACGWGKADVFVRIEEMPSCDDCGVPTKVDWSHGIAPSVRGHGYGSFTAIDMGVLGKAETKEDYDRAVATIQQRFPGHRVELTSETQSQKQARLDGVRQRHFESQKKAGVDGQMVREAQVEQSAKKAEAAAKAASHNVAPPSPRPAAPAGAA